MSRRLYECTTCGEHHTSALGMMMCCEVPLPGDYDDNPSIITSDD